MELKQFSAGIKAWKRQTLMELKQLSLKTRYQACLLLIVPYGIETNKNRRCKQRVWLF